MTTEIYITGTAIKSQRVLEIELFDWDSWSGEAVWKTSCEDDVRFVEGNLYDEVWTIVDRAAKAYDEEENEQDHGNEYQVCRSSD